MASNQEKFVKEIIDGINQSTGGLTKMLNGFVPLVNNSFKNIPPDQAKEVNDLLKKNNTFENLNKAIKELENLKSGK